jgi:hypothetical protein
MSSRVKATLLGSFRQYRPQNTDNVFIPGQGGSYNYDQTNAGIGLSFDVTDRLTLNGEYGHAWLNYDVISNSDSPTWLANISYKISSALTIGTSYSKDYVISVEDGPTEDRLASAKIVYDDYYKISFNIYKNKSKYVEISREDDFYGGELTGELPFNDRIGLTGLLRYDNFDRTGLDAEKYDRYGTRLALYYQTRLGRISTGHVYNRNDSNSNDQDYTGNIVFVNAALLF